MMVSINLLNVKRKTKTPETINISSATIELGGPRGRGGGGGRPAKLYKSPAKFGILSC